MSRLLLAFAVLSSTALTQTAAVEPFDRSRFLPDGYHNITHLDLRAMRESGVWDEISTGPMRLMLKQAEQSLGFPLAKLDRATITPQATPAGSPAGSDEPRPRDLSVTIFEGNAALSLPPMIQQLGMAEERVGPLTILRRDDAVYCQPSPNIVLGGSWRLLEPALTGDRGPGRPAPDILSLLSERKPGLLAYSAAHLGDDQLAGDLFPMLFPGVEWKPGERPRYLFVRLLATGDPDDPHLQIEAVLRHPQADAGLDVTAKAIAELLERGANSPKFRAVAPLLKNIELERDGTDLSFTIDFGRARAASGKAAELLGPLLAPRRRQRDNDR